MIQKRDRGNGRLVTMGLFCSDNQSGGMDMSVSCSSGLAKSILQGTVKAGRRQGRLRKKEVERQHQRMDRPGVRKVPEGSGEQRKKWRKLIVKSSVVPQRPPRLMDW